VHRRDRTRIGRNGTRARRLICPGDLAPWFGCPGAGVGIGRAAAAAADGDPGNVIGLSLPLLRHMLADLGLAITNLWRAPVG
jgi:hypothetical protein